jgi:hypothetical protein
MPTAKFRQLVGRLPKRNHDISFIAPTTRSACVPKLCTSTHSLFRQAARENCEWKNRQVLQAWLP